jgi:hypothetical protein
MTQSVVMPRPEPRRLEPDIVPRNLLRDIVFSRLLAAILRGQYRVGQRLRLDGIAGDMRVSRTPVREALVSLEILRLVHVQRYIGVVIADWSMQDMIERVQIVHHLLRAPDENAPVDQAPPFDPSPLRDCTSEAGTFAVLAEWVLHRLARPISADWVCSQRPALDVFYRDDIAAVHAIDMTNDAAARMDLLVTAQGAAVSSDTLRCATALRQYAMLLAAVHEPFRHLPADARGL